MYQDLKVSLEQVQENFRRYGLLDDQVGFIKGCLLQIDFSGLALCVAPWLKAPC